MLNTIIFLLLGLGLLMWGAEWLVKGASKLARAIGISPLAIGLTIVAYGTSTPELIVNIKSALAGQDDIALGNIVGSNIFNVLFVLGVCGLISPLKVQLKLIRLDVPLMIGASFLLLFSCLDYRLSAVEGIIFIIGIVLYTWFCFSYSKKEDKFIKDEFDKEYGGDVKALRKSPALLKDVLLIGAGLVLLVIGAKWLINSSIEIARYFNISELVISLTIVAAGTSLPEVATSIIATMKGERDIAIGNVVGSNIYNILAILGVTALIPKGGMAINPVSMALDIPFMVFVAVICLPIFRSGAAISRKEGFLLFSLYVGYTSYLIWSQH